MKVNFQIISFIIHLYYFVISLVRTDILDILESLLDHKDLFVCNELTKIFIRKNYYLINRLQNSDKRLLLDFANDYGKNS
jgi:hypothetical protein